MAQGKTAEKPLVLVVDDDYSHRKLLELLANRLNITVYLSPSCEEALKALDLFAFDLILMDCRMPAVDGFGCTQKIRTLGIAGKAVPIIAITACTAEADRQKCFNAGMDDYLAKPFTLEQLHQKLSFWLRQDAAAKVASQQQIVPEAAQKRTSRSS
jgi:CheY-like chemotaxis protein